MIPERLGNAFARCGARLAPVLKLPSQLVELMFGVQRGVDIHDRLHVIGFLS